MSDKTEIRTQSGKGIFLGPATWVVLGLSIFPLLFSLGMTFTNWSLFSNDVSFQLAGNWSRLLKDARFWTTARNTVWFTVAGVLVQYAIGLSLALLMNIVKRGQAFFRTVYMIPMMMSPVAVAYIIGRMMLNEVQGPVNDLLIRVGLPAVPWVSNAKIAMWTLIMADTWQWTPFVFVILLAGLQSIPQEPYEAARVDGASTWQIFRHITWPLLLPVTVTTVLVRALEMFKTVDIVRVITGGGPGTATESVTLFVYDLGIKQGDIAYASTVAYALLFIVIGGASIYLGITRRYLSRLE